MNRPITRGDIEAKLREINEGVDTGIDAGRDAGRVAAVVGGIVFVGVIYLVGRRHGRKRRTVVEIRRI
jgi:hypothetical protein